MKKALHSCLFVVSLFISCNYLPADDTTFQKYENANPVPKEALFYETLPGNTVKCVLCPWECTLRENTRGICSTRINRNGKLITLTYARPCTINIDPIEKKPFFHFLPGKEALSLAAAGCNLDCKFCQNWQISKAAPEELDSLYIPPEGIIKLAKKSKIEIIAFTYSEPTVFYEYMLDVAKLARKNNMKTVVVSAGFINREPLTLLCKYVDAIKIDLKSFNGDYYQKVVSGRLEPVLETIKTIYRKKVHLEIVYLVIPSLNDKPDEIADMCRWIIKNTGPEVPLHFSRFQPQYKMKEYPPTPVSVVEKMRKIALEAGMKYVYTGNVPAESESESTFCPRCGKLLVKRNGFTLVKNDIINGRCRFCKQKIYGVFN